MLTTTPFLSPREGLQPLPITSRLPSSDNSPTIATTFDVPISRPTIKFFSGFLTMGYAVLTLVVTLAALGHAPQSRLCNASQLSQDHRCADRKSPRSLPQTAEGENQDRCALKPPSVHRRSRSSKLLGSSRTAI